MDAVKSRPALLLIAIIRLLFILNLTNFKSTRSFLGRLLRQ